MTGLHHNYKAMMYSICVPTICYNMYSVLKNTKSLRIWFWSCPSFWESAREVSGAGGGPQGGGGMIAKGKYGFSLSGAMCLDTKWCLLPCLLVLAVEGM